MQLLVKRVDRDGRYETSITRADGVTFSVLGVGHNFAIPHDVAHLVVEKALRLSRGFWGSIADGAVFPTMNYESGRRRPNAAERSKAVLRANAEALSEAEILVRIFNDTIEQGHHEASTLLRRRLSERWVPAGRPARAFSPAEIAAVFASYGRVLSDWRETPMGGTLGLTWDGTEGGRRRRVGARSA